MKSWFKFKSIQNRQVFWFLIVSIIPLLVFGAIVYTHSVRSIKNEAINKLTAIRDLKVQRINDWLDERIGDLHTVSEDYEIKLIENVVNHANPDQADTYTKKKIRYGLTQFLKNYRAYNELFIINPVSGIVEISTNQSHEGVDWTGNPYLTEPIRTGKLFIKDIYCSEMLDRPTMTFSIPIYSDNEEKIFGVLAAHIDLGSSLYPLLRERTGMGETGETFIANKNTVALSELRWHKDAPLQLENVCIAAVNASYGRIGIIEAADYRNEMVLAAYTYIPRTQWGFVAKQDIQEVYHPIRVLLTRIVILLISITAVAIAVAFFLARTISLPIKHLSTVTRNIGEGNLNVHAEITTSDEVGILADTFNEMLHSLKKSQEEIALHRDHLEELVKKRTSELTVLNKELRTLDKIGQQIGTNLSLDHVVQAAIDGIADTINPDLVLIFLRDGDKLNLQGAGPSNSKYIHHETPVHRVGECMCGLAVSEEKPIYSSDIHNDPRCTWDECKKAGLRSFAALPLVSGNKIIGVLGIASGTHRVFKDQDSFLQTLASNIASGLQNALLHTQVQRHAEELETKVKMRTGELTIVNERLEEKNRELERFNKAFVEREFRIKELRERVKELEE